MQQEVLQKLSSANLFGKGGAAFPTATKWEAVLAAEGAKKYIIVNSSEGEMGCFKDLYIWRNHMDKVFGGISYGIKFLNCPVDVYIHINADYLDELRPQLMHSINDYKWSGVKINLSIEKPTYIGGEASALINYIETGTAQPRPRTKFRTTEKGLFESPTMMNNVETFYDVCRILDGDYDNSRFIGIFGDGIEKKFVIRHKISESIASPISQLKLGFDDYYVQVGGSASGAVYDKSQIKDVKLDEKGGVGCLEIFDKKKRDFSAFMRRLADFYAQEGCGKCGGKGFATALKEKVYASPVVAPEEILPFIEDMARKTFCKLCKSIKTPFVTYCNNLLGKNIEVSDGK
jgi:NADH-quinone oxidoreductase subunit F